MPTASPDFAALASGIARQGVAEALPIAFVALGETLAERAGVVNIGIEGVMLTGALAAAVAGAASGSAGVGLLAGAAAGGAMALVFGLLVIHGRCDQIVAGLGINLLALGLTGVVAQSGWEGAPGGASVPTLSEPAVLVCGAGSLLVLTPLLWLVLFRTRWGLSLLAVGEEPRAADAAGVSVRGVRLAAVVSGGVLGGLGGAVLVVGLSGRFQEGMTAGRGFVALALVILGRWSPGGVTLSTLLVGVLFAAQQNLQPLLTADQIHTLYPLMLMSPYVFTLAVLSAGLRSARPPAALGRPFAR